MAIEFSRLSQKLEASLKLKVILLCVLLLVYGLLRLVDFLYDLVALVGGTLLVTYILLGPVNTLEALICWVTARFPKRLQLLHPRILAVFLVYLGFLGLMFISFLRFLPLLNEQVKGFMQELPHYVSQVEERFSVLTEASGAQLFLNPAETKLPVQHVSPPRSGRALGPLLTWIQHYSSGALGSLLDLATTTVSRMIYLLTSLVVLFYLLLDGQKIKQGVVQLLPASQQALASHFLERTHLILYTFIKGQVILGFLAGCAMYAAYSFFEVKYAGMLAAFFGIASILPVVGPWVGLLPGILVVLFSGNPSDLVPLLMLSGAFYMVKEYWLIPKIVGTALEIHPVVVILAFLACNKLAGASGILMAFPIASLIAVAFQYSQESGNRSPLTTEASLKIS